MRCSRCTDFSLFYDLSHQALKNVPSIMILIIIFRSFHELQSDTKSTKLFRPPVGHFSNFWIGCVHIEYCKLNILGVHYSMCTVVPYSPIHSILLCVKKALTQS